MSVTTTELRSTAIQFINDPDSVDVNTIIVILKTADGFYHNDDESFIEDNEYDAIKLMAERLEPSNVYFTGVGSSVRGGKVKLPYQMGSLDQVEIGDIKEWVSKWNLQSEEVVISDKMDGTSAMIIYDNDGCSQIAYSRGDGVEGADITRHIFNIANVPATVPGGALTVRAEVELTETAFVALREAGIVSRSGKPYKNARNMVAGLMNSKTNPDIVYDHLTVIAYEVVGWKESKTDQLNKLEDSGFLVTPYTTSKGGELTDEILAEYLNECRDDTDYAIDGVVIDVDSSKKRAQMNPKKDTLNPAYSIKYKVADASNYAESRVIDVKFAVSKHGYLKPTIHIEPTELVGVTVTKCTGFNAKFIWDNKIQPGCKVKITRSGDVIPFCLGVAKPGPLK